jgi:integral membrane protein
MRARISGQVRRATAEAVSAPAQHTWPMRDSLSGMSGQPGMRTSTRGLRAIALAEGVSFLVLLGVAMPLKYLAGMPLAVKVAGWIHGLLFIAVCVVLARTARRLGWPRRRVAAVVVAALLPFGPFVIDRRLAGDWANERDR